MVAAARTLCTEVDQLDFSSHVPWVYNPLKYAWKTHEQYLRKYSHASCRVLFLGMNPGPWGMAQTGVPFGEIPAVVNWLNINAAVDKPDREHPKRPIDGLACARSEVSGRRLWGLFSEKYPEAQNFFLEHFVANYCPLVFMEESARNITPDKLPVELRQPLEAICDRHLAEVIRTLEPEWVIGIGGFAEARSRHVVQVEEISSVQVGRILHPSPASPAANRDWSGTVERQLKALGVW